MTLKVKIKSQRQTYFCLFLLKILIVASLCMGASVAAPQNFIRLVPATGFGAIPARAIEAKAVS